MQRRKKRPKKIHSQHQTSETSTKDQTLVTSTQETTSTRRDLIAGHEHHGADPSFDLSMDKTFDQFEQGYTYDQTIDEHSDDLFEREIDVEVDSGEGETSGVSIPRSGVFTDLSAEVLQSLSQLGSILNYPARAELNVVGDPCRGLSFILSGSIKIEWMDALGWEPIAQMKQGGVFGVLEWAEAKIWEERITALEPTEVLFIPTQRLNSLIITHPDLQRQTARYTERHQLHTLLGVNPVFQEVAEHDLMRLVDLATRRYTPAGVTLFGPQMILALLFVIERGEVTLSVDDRVVQTLGRGELVNVEFTLADVPQLLTARVSEDATLYALPFDEVEDILKQTDRLMLLRRQAHLLRARALNE